MNRSKPFNLLLNLSEVGQLRLIGFKRRICLGKFCVCNVFVKIPEPIVLEMNKAEKIQLRCDVQWNNIRHDRSFTFAKESRNSDTVFRIPWMQPVRSKAVFTSSISFVIRLKNVCVARFSLGTDA